MKKILSLLLIAVMCVGTMTGCGLVSVNKDKDMAQVVASVNIEENRFETENIYKQEMVSAYMSYGYQYVANYGYTPSKAYSTIIENLVTNKVIVQMARKNMFDKGQDDKFNSEFWQYYKANITGKGNVTLKNTATSKFNYAYLEQFLTEYEIAQAWYNTKLSAESLIESFVENEDNGDNEIVNEDETYTVRENPYDSNKEDKEYQEYELVNDSVKPTEDDFKSAEKVIKDLDRSKYETLYDLNMAVYNGYTLKMESAQKKALSKAKKTLKDLGLITTDDKNNVVMVKESELSETSKAQLAKASDAEKDILLLDYFTGLIKSQYESILVGKYEKSWLSEIEEKLTNQALWEQYVAEYNTQKSNYENDLTAYESAIENATDKTFVVCNPYGEGYGYVLNLLIGFTDEQKALLDAYSSKAGVTKAQIAEYRQQLLSQLVVKDQRATWAYSSYGTCANDEFTFDSKYLLSDLAKGNLNKFNGYMVDVIEKEKEEDSTDPKTYYIGNAVANSISFGNFLTDYLNVEGFGMKGDIGVTNTLELDEEKTNYFKDLMYAFSTDPGSLQTKYGYLYSPKTSATKYVPEFAAASKDVVSKGVGAYQIVATDFGYHIILCTKVVSTAEVYDVKSNTVPTNFVEDADKENTVAYNYKQYKLQSVSATRVNKLANAEIANLVKIEDGKTSNGKVSYFKDTYKDLVTETEEVAQ